MIAECKVRFRDAETKKMHEAGDRFEVSPERFAAINGTKYGVLVVEVPEKKPARRGRPRKAAE